MRTFIYNGMKITPKRQFTKFENDNGLMLPLKSIGINGYNDNTTSISYNYDDFYKKAKKVGASEIDVFIYKKLDVVPCGNELFQLL